MKARIALLISTTAVVCMALTSCGGDGGGAAPATPPSAATPPPPPPMAMTMDLDTAAVLAIVQTKTSDTTSAFAVDGGLVAVTPVGDEMSAPISVDGT